MNVFKVFIKSFKASERNVKIKIEVVFLSSPVIGAGRVKEERGNKGEQTSDSVNSSFSFENSETVSVEKSNCTSFEQGR